MEQTKKLNMTAMSDKTNSNTTAKKEEPAWEHKVAMKVSGVSIAVNLLLSLFKLLAGIGTFRCYDLRCDSFCI